MKESIQNKIDQIRELAKSQQLTGKSPAEENNSEDGLLKAIRNKEEADVFMAGLYAAINLAKAK